MTEQTDEQRRINELRRRFPSVETLEETLAAIERNEPNLREEVKHLEEKKRTADNDVEAAHTRFKEAEENHSKALAARELLINKLERAKKNLTICVRDRESAVKTIEGIRAGTEPYFNEATGKLEKGENTSPRAKQRAARAKHGSLEAAQMAGEEI